MNNILLETAITANRNFLKYATGKIVLNPSYPRELKKAKKIKEEINLLFTEITNQGFVDGDFWDAAEKELAEGGYTKNIDEDNFVELLSLAIGNIVGDDYDEVLYNFYTYIVGTVYEKESETDNKANNTPFLNENSQIQPEPMSISFNRLITEESTASIYLNIVRPEEKVKDLYYVYDVADVVYDLESNFKNVGVLDDKNKTNNVLSDKQIKQILDYIKEKQLVQSLSMRIDKQKRLIKFSEKHIKQECYCDEEIPCIGAIYLKHSWMKNRILDMWDKLEVEGVVQTL
ncbi:hypothetical protein O0Q50_22845 [Priestia aryabhattai]|uniref:Uncharacterized protein n=1 Tax=Priestia aryabhattai TaxID=412384 RepID=A0AAX6NEV1_PRIAR|nr:hypothetical protein [Priestia aryabhattai]MDU9694024.1 hypothetical protein [Priestia aryabhattai]